MEQDPKTLKTLNEINKSLKEIDFNTTQIISMQSDLSDIKTAVEAIQELLKKKR